MEKRNQNSNPYERKNQYGNMHKKRPQIRIVNKTRAIISTSILILVIILGIVVFSNFNKNESTQAAYVPQAEVQTQENKEEAFSEETAYEKLSTEELNKLEEKLLEDIKDEALAPEGYYKLAKIKLIKGEEEKSIEYANKAIELDSENILAKISEDVTLSKIMDKLALSVQTEENEQEEKEEEKKQENKTENKDVAQKSNPTGSTKYYIKVNYGANVVTVYTKDENGYFTVPVKAMVCSTGSATPKSGVYSIKNKWTWGKLFGNVWGHYTTKIVGNILFHSVPYLSADPSTLEYWEYDKLGTSASMGCVRLKVADSKWIFDNMPSGTPVEFYSDSNPGPLGKPGAQKISGNAECRGWDPTDPDGNNPWRKQNSNETTPEVKVETKENIENKNETQANNSKDTSNNIVETPKVEKKLEKNTTNTNSNTTANTTSVTNTTNNTKNTNSTTTNSGNSNSNTTNITKNSTNTANTGGNKAKNETNTSTTNSVNNKNTTNTNIVNEKKN